MVGSVEDESWCGFNLAIPILNFNATALSVPFYPSYPITNYSSIDLCLKIATTSDVNTKILLLNTKKKRSNSNSQGIKIFYILIIPIFHIIHFRCLDTLWAYNYKIKCYFITKNTILLIFVFPGRKLIHGPPWPYHLEHSLGEWQLQQERRGEGWGMDRFSNM